jgi:hypothetical protein
MKKGLSRTLMGEGGRLWGPLVQSSILTTLAAVVSPVACRTPRSGVARGCEAEGQARFFQFFPTTCSTRQRTSYRRQLGPRRHKPWGSTCGV